MVHRDKLLESLGMVGFFHRFAIFRALVEWMINNGLRELPHVIYLFFRAVADI